MCCVLLYLMHTVKFKLLCDKIQRVNETIRVIEFLLWKLRIVNVTLLLWGSTVTRIIWANGIGTASFEVVTTQLLCMPFIRLNTIPRRFKGCNFYSFSERVSGKGL